MLLPSEACQAQCAYCFGPRQGGSMSEAVFDAALDWIEALSESQKTIAITFHGGEPLLVGLDWYARALPKLSRRFGRRLKLGLQSNLWLLDAEFCTLLADHGVALGASLDGPKPINDAQRGQGYFAQTMRGIQLARQHYLQVGAICTFTRQSQSRARKILDFFASEGLPFSVHAAVAVPGAPPDHFFLTPAAYGDLLIQLFDLYLENFQRVRIPTFDQMLRSVSSGESGLCTFGKCQGHFLTIGAQGGITFCNRMAQQSAFQLASVSQSPSWALLQQSPAWAKLQERGALVETECKDCRHFSICQGGCFHQNPQGRDPLCAAYKAIFDHIKRRALDEVFSEDNLNRVVEERARAGFLRKGPLLQVMRGEGHPARNTAQAREIIASVALAESPSPEAALEQLQGMGLISHPAAALNSLSRLWQRLHTPPDRWSNAYIHITYNCNLACTHCYALSRPGRETETMPLDRILSLIRQLSHYPFAKIVITGGEPLTHPQCRDLLHALAHQPWEGPPVIGLRTNLTAPLDDELLALLSGVGEVVVSLDGNEALHDRRRGPGSQACTLENLHRLALLMPNGALTVSAVLSENQRRGPEEDAVRMVASDLGIGVRIKPLLPLGRAAGQPLQPEFDSSFLDDPDLDSALPRPRSTCGLGYNLSIGPDGACAPCHAMAGLPLGNAFEDGLDAVLKQNRLLQAVTVDSTPGCSICRWRYLCGGFCRAWTGGIDPGLPIADCSALQRQAQNLLDWAGQVIKK